MEREYWVYATNVRSLWNKVFSPNAIPQIPPQQSQKEINEKRANILLGEGQLGNALKALVSSGIADSSEATVNNLRAKHPHQNPPTPIFLPLNPERPVASASKEQVEKKMRSFQKGSGAGPDGFRPDYFKDILSAPNEANVKQYVAAYTNFCNLALEGRIPKGVQPFFSGAKLIAIQKADNGIRPIAVGTTDSRMVSKLGSAHVIDGVKTYLSPHQVGVGIDGGANAAVHAVNYVVDEEKLLSGMSVLTVDFANAFNNFDRNHLFREISLHAPALMPLANAKYTIAPHLFYEDTLMSSQSGVQQGDPLGPMFFSLLLHRVIRKTVDACPDLKVNVWYLDDGTLVGPTAEVLRAYQIIVEECLVLGLALNASKCELWWPNGFEVNQGIDQWSQFPPEITRNSGHGIKLLGIPVGQFHAPIVVNHRIDKIESILSAITDSGLTTHAKLILLRSCAAMPKFMFALQSSPPGHILGCISKFDRLVTDTLTVIIGCGISPTIRDRMALPINLGGLGIPTAADTALPAYLGSLIQTLSLKAHILQIPLDTILPPIELLLADFNISMAPDNQLLLAPLRASKQPQQLVSKAVNLKKSRDLGQRMMENGTPIQQRAHLAAELPLAGEWLKALPIPGLQLVMPNRHYVLVLRAYFGLQLYNTGSRCLVCNDAYNDPDGIHASNCGKGGNFIRRHDVLKLKLAQLFREAGFSVETEPNHLFADGSLDRPADVLVRRLNNWRDVAIDVNITGTTNGRDHPAIILERVAASKVAKYSARCEAVDMDFVPLVMDAVGGFHEDAIPVLRKLGNIWSLNRNCTPAAGRSRVAQQICFQTKRVMGEEFAKRDPGPNAIEVVSLEDVSR